MVAPPSKPVIVCGMARSGTTLLGAMVRTCGDIVLFPELSPHSTPALFDLLAQVRATLASQKWRPFTETDLDARIVELLGNVWAAGRDEDAGDLATTRFGLKQPHAEELHEEFSAVLGRFAPQWVYAVREPGAVYESTLRMAKWGDIDPHSWAQRCQRSFAAALHLRDRGDLIAFDIPRAADDAEYRFRRAFEVKDFLGFGKPRGLRPFLKGWPAINVSEGRNAGPLTDREIARRVRSLDSSRQYPDLMDAYEHLRHG
jgi:hypothetical protein